MGAGAQLANSEELAIIQQGAKAWNEWRGKNKERASFNLSGADLHGRDLTGADLRAVNLSNAVLRGATLGKGTLLWNANLSNADLYQTNFRGADLQDVNFSNADLYQADLRESNLQGADLSTAKGGLLSRQLAGSDLTGAKLPEPLSKLYDSLSSVKEISDSAQKLFLALLAGCLYSWLTIAQTTDVELITNRATTPLPIIQAAIPIVAFYVVAPLILVCLYFYFHFYLQKLWEELGSLPAVFTDGRELHKRTDPWLLNDLVRSQFAKLKDGRPFLSYFQALISRFLAWWLVPSTLLLFIFRYLSKHDLIGTSVHALVFAVSFIAATKLSVLAVETLCGIERRSFSWKLLKRPATYLQAVIIALLTALTIWFFCRMIIGVGETWDLAGRPHFAYLDNTDVSVKPPTWTGKKNEEIDQVKGANLEAADLRYVMAQNAFFVKARLARADLRGSFLLDADLRQSDLQNSKLDYARMGRANFNGADLSGASLIQADLTGADLTRANLGGANLTGANLYYVKAKYADFRFARGLTTKALLMLRDHGASFFDPDMLKQLGLPPDHNETLQKQMEAELKQAKTDETKSAKQE